MNKFKIVARLLVVINFISILYIPNGMAHTTVRSEEDYTHNIPSFSDKDIMERLNNISSVIDLNYTAEVGRRIREYTINYRRAGEKILGRVDLYFPLFENEISKRNLPEELKYVAVVESNLEPMALSKSGASGLWQFIKSTGRMKGLEINGTVDERRDPVKSTAAALEYLTDLYERFDDWTLAIAAYNCGPGNVNKAIRRGNSKDFWEIRKYLPNETQKYVPRIIAAMYLMQYYHYHNLTPELPDAELKYTVAINNGKPHNFYKLAQELDMSYNTIKQLNPQFQTRSIPKNNGQHTLVIPRSKYETYLKLHDQDAYNQLLEKRRTRKLKRMNELQIQNTKATIQALSTIEPIALKEVLSKEQILAGVNISH
jgi:membrane-bound lytic murein transglycosylase D